MQSSDNELARRFIKACRESGEEPEDVIRYLVSCYVNAAEAMQQAIQEDKK